MKICDVFCTISGCTSYFYLKNGIIFTDNHEDHHGSSSLQAPSLLHSFDCSINSDFVRFISFSSRNIINPFNSFKEAEINPLITRREVDRDAFRLIKRPADLLTNIQEERPRTSVPSSCRVKPTNNDLLASLALYYYVQYHMVYYNQGIF